MTETPAESATSTAERPQRSRGRQQRCPQPRRSDRRVTSPEGLALLASWVEDPSHLTAGLTRESPGGRDPEVLNRVATISRLLAGPEPDRLARPPGLRVHQRPVNGLRPSASAGDVRRRLPEAESAPPGGVTRRAAWSHHGAVEGPNNSVGHLRHPGVEKLLVEYYKMMDAASAGPVGRAPTPADAWKKLLVRWACPQPPECLELRSVVLRCRSNAGVGAMFIMKMLPLLLPLWLYMLRHMLGRSWLGCILFAALGLVLFRASESLNRKRLRERSQGAEGKVRAFNIPPNGNMPPESKELLAAVETCKSAGESRAQLVARKVPGTGPRDLYLPGGGPQNSMGCSSHGGDPAVAALLQDIRVVRRAALGVEGGIDTDSSADMAELGRQVKMLCEAVGVPHDGGNLSSVDALSEKLQEIKGVVGC